MLSLPAPGLTLADKQAVNKALLASGAAIDEMNCVRKHLSAIKGGRLAAMCAPARVVTLLISDVPGDAPEVIASGPTVPDASTCADALAILRRYRIELPPAARAGLESGAFETPKPGDAVLCRPRSAHDRHAAAEPGSRRRGGARGRRGGAHPQRRDGRRKPRGRQGAGRAGACGGAARRAVRAALRDPLGRRDHRHRQAKAQGLAAGARRGGRATEFLLGCAMALHGEPGVHVLAADTDGIDGIEDNAGAIVTPSTLARAQALGLKAADFLDRNDAYNFFKPLGDLVVPGPTFTNVNDFRALYIA